MAKRGQRYSHRVKFEWTNGARGTNVASSLDEARSKAATIEGYGLRRDDADVTITITTADGTAVESLTTANRLAPQE